MNERQDRLWGLTGILLIVFVCSFILLVFAFIVAALTS